MTEPTLDDPIYEAGPGRRAGLGKIEQLYSVMQTQTKDVPRERMITLERRLAELVRAGKVAAAEAQRWANHPSTFADELKRLQGG
jgi:Tfp pilus assembly pilus retraction ATPase PilT